MEMLLDIARKQFTVGRAFEAKTDLNGVQRLDRKSRLPLWAGQLIVMDEGGADTIMVTLAAAEAPRLTQGQPVTPVHLVAQAWEMGDRHGISFRVDEIRTVAAAKSA